MIYSWMAYRKQYIIKIDKMPSFQHIIYVWGGEFVEEDKNLAHAFLVFDSFNFSMCGCAGSFRGAVSAYQNLKDRHERGRCLGSATIA